MPAKVFKRVIKRGDNVDVSLVPVTAEDLKKIKRLPNEAPVEITIKAKRRPESLGQLWSCVFFVIENIPEQYDGQWNSAEELYIWLKFKVGWTEIVGCGNEVYKYPKPTNFTELKDELEFKEKFQLPALKELVKIMDYSNVVELSEASRHWSKIKHDSVY